MVSEAAKVATNDRRVPVMAAVAASHVRAKGSSMRKYVAELAGTYVLVVGGVGSAVLAGDRIGYLGIALAFGFSLLAAVYAVGHVSGCHVNPAVTLGLALCRKMHVRDVPGYLVAQLAGATLAAASILAIARGAPGGYSAGESGLGANGYARLSPDGYSLSAAFVAEVVLTALLVFTVLGATHLRAPVGFAGVAIGTVLAAIHLVGIPITGTSVNPARSFGPAVIAGGDHLHQLWLFVVAPLVGALAAAGVHMATHAREGVLRAEEAERALPQEQATRLDDRTSEPGDDS